jgi:hypothetical protein
MFLVFGDHKNSSLRTLLWGWASGKKGLRNMRMFLIEKLGQGYYLYEEDEWVMRVLLHHLVNQPRGALRVMRVREVDAEDLHADLGEIVSSGQGVSEPGADYARCFQPRLPARRRAERAPDRVEGESGPRARVGGGSSSTPSLKVYSRIYTSLIKYDNPTEADLDSVSRTLRVEAELVEGLYLRAREDSGIRDWLHSLGYLDERIPRWVATKK